MRVLEHALKETDTKGKVKAEDLTEIENLLQELETVCGKLD